MRKRLRIVLAAVLTACIFLNLPVSVSAEGEEWEALRQESYDTQPDTNGLKGWPHGPQVWAKAAIVMDMDSGAVLYGKNIDERLYPASITKLLTALVALENGDFSDEVVFSRDSVSFLESDHAKIGMKPGESISMKDAMYALLLASANEVAYAVAENVGQKMGGDYDTFIQKMNEKSAQLGCTGSQWTNANGLPDEEHYTTAYDMALIASEVSKHQELLDIMETLSYTIETEQSEEEAKTFEQHHRMLWEGNAYYYPYCIGGKTGYTDSAGTTLVTMADNGQMRLAAVVLFDFGTDAYKDTKAMFDYVYGSFSKVGITRDDWPEEIRECVTDEPYVVLPQDVDVSALKTEFTVTDEKKAAGKMTFTYRNQAVGSMDVVFTPEYVESATGYTTRLSIGSLHDGDGKDGLGNAVLFLQSKAVVGAGAAGAVLFAAVLTVLLRGRRKNRRKIRRRRQCRRMKKERKIYKKQKGGRENVL